MVKKTVSIFQTFYATNSAFQTCNPIPTSALAPEWKFKGDAEERHVGGVAGADGVGIPSLAD